MSRAPKPTVIDAPTEALLWRFDKVVKMTALSRRTIERLRSAGRFPRPDLVVGKIPLWRPETIQRWINNGGGKA